MEAPSSTEHLSRDSARAHTTSTSQHLSLSLSLSRARPAVKVPARAGNRRLPHEFSKSPTAARFASLRLQSAAFSSHSLLAAFRELHAERVCRETEAWRSSSELLS